MIQRFAFAALLLLFLPAARAQVSKGSVKGFISDSTTGERLSLVNVLVQGAGIGAATDANGFYFIGNLPPGKVRIRVTLIGYATREEDVEIRAGKVSALNILLAPVPYELEGVETTAERRVRYDTEISTQPIGAAEIDLVPVTVERDLFRAISILPGVVAPSDVSSQFYVRGGGGDQNLIILDGMTIYNPFHALGIFSIFDADAVREAEILKGGFPAQWGNRLSSVINIRTREGNRNRFSGKFNVSQVSAKTMLEGPTMLNGSWMVAARKSFFDNVLQKFVRQDTPFDFYDVIARVNQETHDNGRLSLHMLFSGDLIRPASVQEPEYAWSNRAYGLSWFQVLESKYLVETTFSLSKFRGELRPRSSVDIDARLSEIEDAYFNGQVTYFQDSGDQFGAGFMFRFPSYHYAFVNAANYYRDEYGKSSETGLWLKYKFKQFRPFAFEVGIRSDLFAILSTNNSDAFEPRLAFSWDLSEALALKLSYARVHQRAVTVTNEDDVVSLFETWIPIPKGAPSQQADHYVVGVDGDIPLVPGLNFNAQGYYKNFTHLLDYNREKVDAKDPDFTSATGKSYGFEVFLEEKRPMYYGWIAYTLSYTERTVQGFTYPPRYDRRHAVNLLAGFKPGDGWDFSLRWEYGSGLPFSQITGFYDRLGLGGLFGGGGYAGEPGEPYTILGDKNHGRLPAYHRLDASAAKSFHLDPITLTLEASVINVYDRRNMFYYNRSTGQRIDMLPILPTLNLRVEF